MTNTDTLARIAAATPGTRITFTLPDRPDIVRSGRIIEIDGEHTRVVADDGGATYRIRRSWITDAAAEPQPTAAGFTIAQAAEAAIGALDLAVAALEVLEMADDTISGVPRDTTADVRRDLLRKYPPQPRKTKEVVPMD